MWLTGGSDDGRTACFGEVEGSRSPCATACGEGAGAKVLRPAWLGTDGGRDVLRPAGMGSGAGGVVLRAAGIGMLNAGTRLLGTSAALPCANSDVRLPRNERSATHICVSRPRTL